MTDDQYFEAIDQILKESHKIIKSKRYFPKKSDMLSGLQLLIDKTFELRSKK